MIDGQKEVKYYNVYDVARFLGVSHTTVRQWIRQGTLKANKFGRRVLIPQSSLDRFIEEAEKGATEKTK